MEIHFKIFIYIISLSFSIAQSGYILLKLLANRQNNLKITDKLLNFKKLILLNLLIGYSIFNLYNISGLFIAYYQGHVSYRTLNSTKLEDLMLILEIVFDAMQRNGLIFSFLLILNYIKTIKSSTNSFILSLACFNLTSYVSLIAFLPKPSSFYISDLLFFIIDILLFFTLVWLYDEYTKLLIKNKKLYQAENTLKSFRTILTFLLIQFFLNVFFKLSLFIVNQDSDYVWKYVLADYAFLLRLIFITLQVHCILSFHFFPLQIEIFEEKSDVNIELTIEDEEKLGPIENLFYDQPNVSGQFQKPVSFFGD